MRIGSLFSGAGGLDLAVEQVFGGRTVWHCELDPAASKVLAHRWPDVPNLGDITEVNWNALRFHINDIPGVSFKVDILCGGYPCQPFSAAGQRKGTDDERHLWPYFAETIRVLRPRYVVLENVAGHRSMGLSSVLADLAGIGYVGSWCSLRASDVGAPHRRERVFVVAHPADAASNGWHQRWPQPEGFVGGFNAAVGGHEPVDLLPTPAACRSGNNQSPSPGAAVRPSLDSITELLPTPSTALGTGGQTSRSGSRKGEPLLGNIGDLLPTPNASDSTGGGAHPDNREGHSRQLIDYALLHGSSRWGRYAPAIERWEGLTRSAPSPTEPNTKGNPRLSAPFAEWMMGWPAGWVTEVPGISRNDQLRIIGNGVVPQQASEALRYLLSVCEAVATELPCKATSGDG